jgi:hypothetical protein
MDNFADTADKCWHKRKYPVQDEAIQYKFSQSLGDILFMSSKYHHVVPALRVPYEVIVKD